MDWRQKANTPRTEDDADHFRHAVDNLRKGDLVYLDYKKRNVGGRYGRQRGPIYRIHNVQTAAKPFIYKLQNITNRKLVHGWFYGAELLRSDLVSGLEIEKVLRTKKSPDGKSSLIYVKFKDHDASFNRWIEN